MVHRNEIRRKIESTKKNSKSGNDVAIGIVGHIPVGDLKYFKDILLEFDSFNIVFFKTSKSRLWIVEGENNL